MLQEMVNYIAEQEIMNKFNSCTNVTMKKLFVDETNTIINRVYVQGNHEFSILHDKDLSETNNLRFEDFRLVYMTECECL